MTLVEIEGCLLIPQEVEFVDIAPGQRVSVLVRAEHAMDYPILSRTMYFIKLEDTKQNSWRKGETPQANATLRVSSDPTQPPPVFNQSIDLTNFYNREIPQKFEEGLVPLRPIPMPNATRTIVLRAQQLRIPNGRLKWAINNVSFVFPPKALLLHAYANTLQTLPLESRPIDLGFGQVVDVVIVNLAGPTGVW